MGVICHLPWMIYMYKIIIFFFFKFLLLWNSMSNFHQISHGIFWQKGMDNLFEWFHTIELEGRHADIWLKLLKIFSRPKKDWGWILVYSIGVSRSTTFVQLMVVGWPLTFLWQAQICALIHLYGENEEKSFLARLDEVQEELLHYCQRRH